MNQIPAVTKPFCSARAFAYCIVIVRFNVLLLIAGAALLLVDQGQDLLVGLAEDVLHRHRHGWRLFLFYSSVLLWGFSLWLWARTLLDVNFGDAPNCPFWLPFWRAWLPRVLGTLAFFAVAWALWRTRDLVDAELGAVLTRMTWANVAGGIAFWAFVIYRRPLSRWLATWIGGKFQAKRVTGWLHASDIKAGDDFPLHSFWQIFTGARGVFINLSVLLGTVLFFWSWIDPVSIGRWFDVIALVLIWAGTWLPIGSFITYAANRTGIPFLALLLIGAMLFSYHNDNHEIRHAAEPLPIAERPTVNAAIEQWRDHHREGIETPIKTTTEIKTPNKITDKTTKTPMVIVATAGGGIRAAYWTATVLGTLQDKTTSKDKTKNETPTKYPENQPPTKNKTPKPFDDYLFAVSGVSGGSVGAAVYRATLGARQEAPGGALKCGSVLECSQSVFSEDLLGPAAAAFLYPDLAQRFWPWPVTSADRGRALEKGWEAAFEQITGSDLFARSLIHHNQVLPLDDGNATRPWPALLMNATWAGNGRRLIASNLAPPPSTSDPSVDQLGVLGRDIPLSTAAHNSARFPGVSPAGMWKQAMQSGESEELEERIAGRLLDGGYYENFGADTARELLERIKDALGEDEFNAQIRPVVIVISSDPAINDDPAVPAGDAPVVEFGYEVRAILRGLTRTRNARGAEAFAGLRQWTTNHGGEFFHLRMCGADHKLDPPLGWVLSASARDAIQDYLNPDGRYACGKTNNERVNEIVNLITPSQTPLHQ